jgi:hypothetical protein
MCNCGEDCPGKTDKSLCSCNDHVIPNTYAGRVEYYLKGLEHVSCGPCPGCAECESIFNLSGKEFEEALESGQIFDEGSHSSGSCDACGTTQGGKRYMAHGLSGADILHFSVCTDCLFYITYGEEPEPEED